MLAWFWFYCNFCIYSIDNIAIKEIFSKIAIILFYDIYHNMDITDFDKISLNKYHIILFLIIYSLSFLTFMLKNNLITIWILYKSNQLIILFAIIQSAFLHIAKVTSKNFLKVSIIKRKLVYLYELLLFFLFWTRFFS